MVDLSSLPCYIRAFLWILLLVGTVWEALKYSNLFIPVITYVDKQLVICVNITSGTIWTHLDLSFQGVPSTACTDNWIFMFQKIQQ